MLCGIENLFLRLMFFLNSSDPLWSSYGHRVFPEAAVAISDAFQDYSARKAQLDQGNVDGLFDSTGTSDVGGVQSTLLSLNAVPEMVVKKKYAESRQKSGF